MATRIIAVDWSGRARAAQRHICLAECHDGILLRVESGRDRDQIIQHIIEISRGTEGVFVGLDFSFSFPQWFAEERKLNTIDEIWNWVSKNGENILRDCPPPFWGRKGTHRPDGIELFRMTEERLQSVNGPRPKSTFQIAGGGAVGTGSLRGMPHLAKLRCNGFSIWPFDKLTRRTVIEIYPRLLTGKVNKSSKPARSKYLKDNFPHLNGDVFLSAVSTEDAFDAAVSTLIMSRHLGELSKLYQAGTHQECLEGKIWCPGQS